MNCIDINDKFMKKIRTMRTQSDSILKRCSDCIWGMGEGQGEDRGGVRNGRADDSAHSPPTPDHIKEMWAQLEIVFD